MALVSGKSPPRRIAAALELELLLSHFLADAFTGMTCNTHREICEGCIENRHKSHR